MMDGAIYEAIGRVVVTGVTTGVVMFAAACWFIWYLMATERANKRRAAARRKR